MKKYIIIISLIISACAGKSGPKSSTDVYAFLEKDQTDTLIYNEDTFHCIQFSETLINNARAEGFSAEFVTVYWPEFDTAHAFVAFRTSDKPIMWVEPQSDAEYIVVDFSKPIPMGGDVLCRTNGRCWPGEIVIPRYSYNSPIIDEGYIIVQ